MEQGETWGAKLQFSERLSCKACKCYEENVSATFLMLLNFSNFARQIHTTISPKPNLKLLPNLSCMQEPEWRRFSCTLHASNVGKHTNKLLQRKSCSNSLRSLHLSSRDLLHISPYKRIHQIKISTINYQLNQTQDLNVQTKWWNQPVSCCRMKHETNAAK